MGDVNISGVANKGHGSVCSCISEAENEHVFAFEVLGPEKRSNPLEPGNIITRAQALDGHKPLVSPGMDLVPSERLEPLYNGDMWDLVDPRRHDHLVELGGGGTIYMDDPLLPGFVACHARNTGIKTDLVPEIEVVRIAL